MKKEKLYLTSWEYNTYRIINDLKKQVLNKGGHILQDATWTPTPTTYEIHNRTLSNYKDELKKTIDTITNNLKTNDYDDARRQQLVEYLDTKKTELAELEKIKDKKNVQYKNYITFLLDDFVYYLQFDSNPFFEHYYTKEKIDEVKDNCYIVKYQHYMNELSRDFLEVADMYAFDLKQKDIKNVVNSVLTFIENSPASEVVIEKQQKYCYSCGHSHMEAMQVKRQKSYKAVE